MDLNREKNHKFNFFKTNSENQSLGFLNLRSNTDYISFFIIFMWVLSGMFFRSDLRNQPITDYSKPQVVATSMSTNAVIQGRIDFISKAKGLEGSSEKTTKKSSLLNNIIEKLGLTFVSYKNVNDRFEVTGYLGGKQKMLLSYDEETVNITWKSLSQKEVDEFSQYWSGGLKIVENNKAFDLIVNTNRNIIKSVTNTSSLQIKKLEAQIEKLEKEQLVLKKDNANLVIQKTLKSNPHLQVQEKQVKKFVDEYLELSSAGKVVQVNKVK